MIVGEVKLCTYSELQNITDFKPESLIQKTLSGRLFCGTIGEGSEKRPAIVKTWDFLLPLGDEHTQRLHKFCVCLQDWSEFDFLSIILGKMMSRFLL